MLGYSFPKSFVKYIIGSSRVAANDPQCGQHGPCGQRVRSRCARAAVSSWKIGSVRSIVIGIFLLDLKINLDPAFVKGIIGLSTYYAADAYAPSGLNFQLESYKDALRPGSRQG